ncbi:unnamed protein product [Vitrella brassicaformis CCMP3155]|uniref:Uncharacterized protein n=2 Tax=Vitrella brassicaformis TaxID=1169539 RepID=A0A0G4EWX4_VITBC|nr:unnamed protein product [Vitrella brassicaformis CCMP3155]|eukprot:CEM02787.1 unnamed protein product [Vitrella brassicaformis CCMP3155]
MSDSLAWLHEQWCIARRAYRQRPASLPPVVAAVPVALVLSLLLGLQPCRLPHEVGVECNGLSNRPPARSAAHRAEQPPGGNKEGHDTASPSLDRKDGLKETLSSKRLAAIEGLSQYRVDQVSSALQSDFFDISHVPAVLPVVPLLPSAIQTAFKSALKKAVDAQDEEAFDQLYDHLIERESTRKKEAAERHRLEAEIQRLREEIGTLRSRESRGEDGQGEEGEAA